MLIVGRCGFTDPKLLVRLEKSIGQSALEVERAAETVRGNANESLDADSLKPALRGAEQASVNEAVAKFLLARPENQPLVYFHSWAPASAELWIEATPLSDVVFVVADPVSSLACYLSTLTEPSTIDTEHAMLTWETEVEQALSVVLANRHRAFIIDERRAVERVLQIIRSKDGRISEDPAINAAGVEFQWAGSAVNNIVAERLLAARDSTWKIVDELYALGCDFSCPSDDQDVQAMRAVREQFDLMVRARSLSNDLAQMREFMTDQSRVAAQNIATHESAVAESHRALALSEAAQRRLESQLEAMNVELLISRDEESRALALFEVAQRRLESRLEAMNAELLTSRDKDNSISAIAAEALKKVDVLETAQEALQEGNATLLSSLGVLREELKAKSDNMLSVERELSRLRIIQGRYIQACSMLWAEAADLSKECDSWEQRCLTSEKLLEETDASLRRTQSDLNASIVESSRKVASIEERALTLHRLAEAYVKRLAALEEEKTELAAAFKRERTAKTSVQLANLKLNSEIDRAEGRVAELLQALKNLVAEQEQAASEAAWAKPVAISFDLRSRCEGTGWHDAEHDGRWTGPGVRSEVRLPNKMGILRTVRILVADTIRKVRNPFRAVRINGQNTKAVTTRDGNIWVVEVVFEDISSLKDYITIELEATTVAEPRNSPTGDTRTLGVKVERIELLAH